MRPHLSLVRTAPAPLPTPIQPHIPIKDWDESEQPRERLLERGAQALSDAELLAIFLRTGAPGVSAVDFARRLIERFGTLRNLMSASPHQLRALHGIGKARASTLLAVSELSRRVLYEKLREEPVVLNSPGAVQTFLEEHIKLMIANEPREVFVCVYLDPRHRLLAAEKAATGSLTRVAVYPREIVRRAIELNAAGLIVAHNHPSGESAASGSDHLLTRTLRDALALIDVRLLDHFVIGAHEVSSFAKNGWL
jgi:DNA repair protein RadC